MIIFQIRQVVLPSQRDRWVVDVIQDGQISVGYLNSNGVVTGDYFSYEMEKEANDAVALFRNRRVEMTKQLTEIRESYRDKSKWVVDILMDSSSKTGYIQPTGYRGSFHEYDTKAAAEEAEALYLKLNSTCNDCDNNKSTFINLGGCEKSYQLIMTNPPVGDCKGFKPKTSAVESELGLHPSGDTKATNPEIRKFETGATRDTVEGKLDYVKALCPLVLRRYVQYLNKHRLQPDGSMRDFDNWKKGIPRETYHSSKGRHFFADWLLEEGYEVSDNHGPIEEEDALCAEIFNAMGKLREILRAKLNPKE